MADQICADSGFTIDSRFLRNGRRRNMAAFFLLALLVVLVYGNSLDCSWHYDDKLILTGNKNLHLKSLTFKDLVKTFYGPRTQGRIAGKSKERLIRPVAQLTLALNWYFGQDNVFGYHLVNLLIHLVTSLFLFLFVKTTLKLPKLNRRYGNMACSAALLTAALWTVSPVHVSAVTYIVQRMASLAGMGMVAAMYFYARARISRNRHGRITFFLAAVFCWLLALGSKENAVVLPFILVLYDLLLIQDIRLESWHNALKHIVLPAVVVVFLGFALIWMHYSGFQAMLKDYRLFSFTLTERLLTEPRIILFYISALLYPIQSRIALVYDIQTSQSLLEFTRTALPFLIVIGFFVLAVFLISRRRYLVSFCILFFFLNHIPEGTVVPLHLIFLHRNYLPSLLFFLPIVLLLFKVLDYFAYNRPFQYSLAAGIGILIACHGSTTISLNHIWKSEESLWQDNVKKSPALSLPHTNFGNALFVAGKYDEALIHFQKAVELNRQEVLTLRSMFKLNLARVYLMKNEETEQTIDIIRQVLAQKAFAAEANHTMSLALLRKGRYEEALKYSKEAVVRSKDNFNFNLRHGLVLLKNGRQKEALAYARKAMMLKPSDKLPYAIVGEFFKREGNKRRSIFFWERFQKAYPLNVTGILALIELYESTGQDEKAKRQVQRLLRISGDSGPYGLIQKCWADKGVNVYLPDKTLLTAIIKKYSTDWLVPHSD